jgi:hypothetical protein
LRYFDFFFIFDFPVSLYLRGKIKGKQKMGKKSWKPAGNCFSCRALEMVDPMGGIV